MQFQKKWIVLLIGLVIIYNACKKDFSPLGQEPQASVDTTSHVFEWTADTIYAEDALQIYLTDIWGTDENDVWAVGHSDVSKYQIWHWNGKKWQYYQPGISYGRASYYEIFGFGKSNFWIVGDVTHYDSTTGYILHFDKAWQRVDNGDLPMVLSVWGTSSNNMYFGCFDGVIAKYNGSEFIRYQTDKDVQFRSIWGFNDSTIFALGNKIVYTPNVTLSIGVLYKFKTNNFVLIDSAAHYDKGFGMDLWGYNFDSFYSAMNGVFKYNIDEWIPQFYSTTIYSVFGSSAINIFAGGYQNTFYHYNGDNWKKIENIPYSINNRAIWCKEDYVFVVQDFGNYSRIVKGKMIK